MTHQVINADLSCWPCDCDSPIDHGRPTETRVEQSGYFCLLTEDNDGEAFAALPECPHCDGSGKDLTGSPWEDTR